MKNTFFLTLFSVLMLANGFHMTFSPLVIRSSWTDWGQGILLIIVSGFGLFRGISDWWSTLKGDPVMDELTRKISQKAAAQAFRISVWGWLGLMMLSRSNPQPTFDLVITGILMMGCIYILSVVIIRVRGLRDE
ncbi:MAG: hypothetical protein NTW16_00555 [Bacteroidetes bacterium]|nr:hypothetical protein [Bacteroidota bacterium]